VIETAVSGVPIVPPKPVDPEIPFGTPETVVSQARHKTTSKTPCQRHPHKLRFLGCHRQHINNGLWGVNPKTSFAGGVPIGFWYRNRGFWYRNRGFCPEIDFTPKPTVSGAFGQTHSRNRGFGRFLVSMIFFKKNQ
jgi:hypothetical protein